MPEDYDLYYGFTRFAIELNEMEHDQIHLYAPTDTRFRKDQRSVLLLTNGIRFMSEVIVLHTSRSGLDTCTGIYMYMYMYMI